MKRLVILSDESIVAGNAKCGVAELVDSLANVMAQHYHVCVVCPAGTGSLLRWAELVATRDSYSVHRLLNVDYYIVSKTVNFNVTVPRIIDEIQPDILHNFSVPDVIQRLASRPARTIYTIDRYEDMDRYLDSIELYDCITVGSVTYAEHLRQLDTPLGTVLKRVNFRGINNGILSTVFDPGRGLLLPASFTAANTNGKRVAKQTLCATYGIPENKCVFLMMCRMIRNKGVDEVLSVIHQIRDAGGFVLFVGRGESRYEDALSKLTHEDGAFWTRTWAAPAQAIPLLGGADFFLSPSGDDVCPLMPMTASRYGAIPIVSDTYGLHDVFTTDTAIVITDTGLTGAVQTAVDLYKNKIALAKKRRAVMIADHSWDTRKKGYLEVYES